MILQIKCPSAWVGHDDDSRVSFENSYEKQLKKEW